jgi:hypothetical protein
MRIVTIGILILGLCDALLAQTVREAVALANQGKVQEAVEMFETLYPVSYTHLRAHET